MKLEYQHLIDPSLAPQSRVWIYQSNRTFTIAEALKLEKQLEAFTAEWTSHGAAVKGAGYLFFGQFLILIADETAATVSGCSTDKSVHFIQSIEKEYGVLLLDFTTLAFLLKDKIQLLPMAQLPYAIEHGYIGPATPYFNNLVSTLFEFQTQWIIPCGRSWLAKRLPTLAFNEPA
ncbi:MAG: hypothetical protein FJX92_03930 [Bacteroidetes bacterium]|nr:hypothetical protein [Bacteroidota bacterium]